MTSGAGRDGMTRGGAANAMPLFRLARSVHKTALPPTAMRLRIRRRRSGFERIGSPGIMRSAYHGRAIRQLDAMETIAMRDELLHPGTAPLMRYGRAGR